jgi:chemotaxis protein MotB
MQIVKFSWAFLVCTLLVVLSGCVGQQHYNDLKIQNDTQRERIAELESQLRTAELQLDQLTRKLATSDGRAGTDINALQQKIAALEEYVEKKQALIASMQEQLLHGGIALPVELSTMLEDFAADKAMVEYDPKRGIVKFKSDLLFESGSAVVAAPAAEVVKSLCSILNSERAKEFDIVIAGHTDDMRIARPETRAKHATNWHLSAHRAISVLEIMTNNGVGSDRMSVRGFGQFRPIAANAPNQKGNAQNRRVEIYIVPRGT